MTFSALDSELTGPLFATADMRAIFADRARLEAMLTVEASLAEAEARHGLVPSTLAGAIRKIGADQLDAEAIGRDTATAGVPTIPFLKAVEALLPEKLRGHFHKGATSQDIFDTAFALQAAAALDLIAADIAAVIDGLAAMAKRYQRTPQAGRTLGQQAAPITFGYAVAVWLTGIADAAAELAPLRGRSLVAALGGPVGTLAGLGGKGRAVADDFAAILGLASPAVATHVARGGMLALGAWLTGLVGALAKIATDVVFLSSTEVGEVVEASAPGRGGSSAMPHKRNPVSATVILAAQTAAPGHLVTLANAMAAPLQRPAGAWQGEWHALPSLFGLASGALREGRRIAEGLTVDDKRMRANLGLTRGLLFADAVSSRLAPHLGRDGAQRLVARAATAVAEGAESLQAALIADADIPAKLHAEIAAAFDLAPAIDAASRATDRALDHARTVRRSLGGASPARKPKLRETA